MSDSRVAANSLLRARSKVLARLGNERNWADFVFRRATALSALLVVITLGSMALAMAHASLPGFREFGLGFVFGSAWDPAGRIFGALPFVYGTVVSSSVALLLAVPVSLGIAIYLSELAPDWLRNVFGFLVELLAAVPSVVYGLWGIFVLAPWLRDSVQPRLADWFGFLPAFSGPQHGFGMLAGGVVLAIMITPTISSVGREVLRAVPLSLREGGVGAGGDSLGIGADRRAAVRPLGLDRRDAARPGASIGRNDGDHVGDRQPRGDQCVVVCAGVHHGQRDRQRVQRSDGRAASRGAGRDRSAPVRRDRALEPGRARTRMARVGRVGAGAAVRLEHYAFRRFVDRVVRVSCVLSMGLALLPLCSVLYYVFSRGIPGLDLAFFTERPLPVGEPGGGMAPAIVGTLQLVGLSCLFAIPPGVLAGVYLSEYGETRFGRIARFAADVLSGVPSPLRSGCSCTPWS